MKKWKWRLNSEVETVSYREIDDNSNEDSGNAPNKVKPESLAQKLARLAYSDLQWFLKRIGKNK